VKIIREAVIPLFLAAILTACDGLSSTSTPPTTPTDAMETAISRVKTETVGTQAEIFTVITKTPKIIPSGAYSNDQAYPPPADKLDYAMAVAPKIYTRLPYINTTTPYGEYSGCIETYDFHNFVTYVVTLPIETVNAAFLTYFSTEHWEFTEAASEYPITTYDVYRISSNVKPSFERLGVFLTDESTLRGEDHIDVRVELTHVETKENLHYLSNHLTCNNNGAWWLWIRLTR
jgi:hypothetical protein